MSQTNVTLLYSDKMCRQRRWMMAQHNSGLWLKRVLFLLPTDGQPSPYGHHLSHFCAWTSTTGLCFIKSDLEWFWRTLTNRARLENFLLQRAVTDKHSLSYVRDDWWTEVESEINRSNFLFFDHFSWHCILISHFLFERLNDFALAN